MVLVAGSRRVALSEGVGVVGVVVAVAGKRKGGLCKSCTPEDAWLHLHKLRSTGGIGLNNEPLESYHWLVCCGCI